MTTHKAWAAGAGAIIGIVLLRLLAIAVGVEVEDVVALLIDFVGGAIAAGGSAYAVANKPKGS